MRGKPVPEDFRCYCEGEGEMQLRNSEYGLRYECQYFEVCGGMAAIHRDGSLKSLPANKETKAARMGAHGLFDKLWKEGLMSRSQAYRLLSKHMGLSKKDTHMGYFTEEQCDQVVEFVQKMVMEEEHQT